MMNANTSYMTVEEQRRTRDSVILEGLAALRLPGMAEYYRERFVDNPNPPEDKSIEEFMEEMVGNQLALRTSNRTMKYTRNADLWFSDANLENLTKRNAALTKSQVEYLSKCKKRHHLSGMCHRHFMLQTEIQDTICPLHIADSKSGRGQ